MDFAGFTSFLGLVDAAIILFGLYLIIKNRGKFMPSVRQTFDLLAGVLVLTLFRGLITIAGDVGTIDLQVSIILSKLFSSLMLIVIFVAIWRLVNSIKGCKIPLSHRKIRQSKKKI